MRYFVLGLVMIVALGLFLDVVEPSYGFFGKVPTASVGVITRFGKIEKETLGPGFHVKGWFDKINSISTKTQKYSVNTAAFSSDIQQVDVVVSLNYNVDSVNAPALFETVGKTYETMLIQPRLIENVKIVIARYNAEALLKNRGTLASEILVLLQEDLIKYGINASSVAIEDIDFTDAFTAAVEAKQVATQEKLTAQTEQEKQTMAAQAEAEREIIAAEAAAEVKRIEADTEAYGISTRAEAEAEANEKVAASLTQELIDYTHAQNWNGELPTTYAGSTGVLPILNANE